MPGCSKKQGDGDAPDADRYLAFTLMPVINAEKSMPTLSSSENDLLTSYPEKHPVMW